MAESWRSRMMRWRFNRIPAYRGTGARVTYIAGDWREVRIELPLNRRTRNYVGTIFGGSLYGAVDPLYMMMLIHILGKGYVVWDKAATIRFKKPGRSTLHARFTLSDADLAEIREQTQTARSIDRVFQVQLTDAEGVVHAEVEKVIYIRRAAETAPSQSEESYARSSHR